MFDLKLLKATRDMEEKYQAQFQAINDKLEKEIAVPKPASRRSARSGEESPSTSASEMLARMDLFMAPKGRSGASKHKLVVGPVKEFSNKSSSGKDPAQLEAAREEDGLRTRLAFSTSGEYGWRDGRGNDLEDELSLADGASVSESVLGKEDIGSSARNEELKRVHRLAAEKDNYDPGSHRCLTMCQLVSTIRSKEGLIIFDVAGSAHSVALQKDVHNKTLNTEVTLLSGPFGKRDKNQCGVKERCPNIFPQSRVQYLDFMREQTDMLQRISKAALVNKDYSAYQMINEDLATLYQFNEQFSRRVELVMGGVGMHKPHHITRWAVLLHFLIITWNTAMTRGEFKYLTLDFDNRWNQEFEALIQETNGRTLARIDDCMKFLLYVCPTQTCGSLGFCAEFCFYCKTPVKGGGTTAAALVGNKAPGFYKAWSAYLAIGTNKTTGSKVLFLASAAGAPFRDSKATTPAVASRTFSNVTEAYSVLETHQDLVIPHPSPLRSVL
jgi:hypothetical protein